MGFQPVSQSTRKSLLLAQCLEFGHLWEVRVGEFAPTGLEDSAQGFNLVSTLGTVHP
jgi:hypothetical protein